MSCDKRKRMDFLEKAFNKKLKIIDSDSDSLSGTIIKIKSSPDVKIFKKRSRDNYEETCTEDPYPKSKKPYILKKNIEKNIEKNEKDIKIERLEKQMSVLEDDIKLLKRLFNIQIKKDLSDKELYWGTVLI